MASIQSLGLGSSVLTSELVEQIIEADRAASEKLINDRKTLTEAKISAYGELDSKLSAFQSSVAELVDEDVISAVTATSSDETLLTATGGSSAVPGTYTVEVQAIAQAHSLASKSYADTSTVVSTAGGVLEFSFGTTSYNMGAYDSFSENADKSGATINVAANATLSDIRDAINNADFGVTAAIIFDGSGYKLSLVSDDSGADNSLEIVARSSAGGPLSSDGLEALAYNVNQATASNLTEAQQAQDAVLTFNGLSVTRESNSITDLITGTTLNLKSANVGTNVTVTVAADVSTFSTKIDAMVTAYNDLKTSVDFYTDYDADKNEAGLLTGDSAVRSMFVGVNNILASAVSGITGKEFESFSEIGLERDENDDFKLKFDSVAFSNAMNEDRDTVINIFGISGSTSDSLIQYMNDSANTKAGTYDINLTTLATRGQLEGATISALDFSSPVVIDDSNDTYTINVDGNSGSFTLSQGSYTTGNSLAAELQSKINAVSGLSSKGSKVSVTYDSANKRFDIISNLYGSSSQVYFTAVDTNSANSLGFNTLGKGTFEGSDLSSLSSSYLVGLGASTQPTSKSISSTTGFNFSTANATFSISVDGSAAEAIVVNQDALGSDLNGDSVFGDRLDVLQAIQNAIDATALNGHVTASFDSNDKLLFTTTAVGSAKSIEITSATTTGAGNLFLDLSDDDGVQTNGRDAGLTIPAGTTADFSFDLTLDGTTTSTPISVAAGTYTTGNDIATAVETAINTALAADANFTPLVVGASTDTGTRDISTAIDFSAANSGFKLNVNGTEQEVIITADATATDNITEINAALDAAFGAGVVTASLDGTGLKITTDTTGHTQYIQMVSDGRGAQTTAGAVAINTGVDFTGTNAATFDLVVDGVTLSVNVNTDASAGGGSDTLAAVQSAIDVAAVASGQFQAGDILASLDSSDNLVLETISKNGVKTANTYGSSASIEITAIGGTAAANLGLAIHGPNTNGYDAFGINDDFNYGYDTTAVVEFVDDTANGTGSLQITVGGNATTIAFSNVGAEAISNLGIHAPDGSETTPETGTNVAGTINGVAASGSGQFLTAQKGNTAAINGYYVANQSAIVSSSVTVDATNDKFTVNLNGVEAEVSVAQGTYATGDALASAIESAINTTTAFSSLTYGVKAEYTSDASSALFGKISLISNIKGKNSKVEMVTVSAAAATAYGFEVGQADGEPGADAVGSVDNAAGIRIKVLGGSTGSRGTVSYISGLADQLNDLLDTYLESSTGIFDLRVGGLNDDLDDLAEEQTELDARMENQEALLRAQFLAADAMIAEINNMANFITQQFDAFAAAKNS